ncbi:ATP-binding protein [[Ruminococcus] lactaris]|uniref:ATP-binding protein n=1 Tax=[Ruminococcus] lactaris TaxID=46228 RepID=UPI001D03CADF|nr:ATP-binding protein [[Ruminococcus] lactaris]MCB5552049.1 ATP-binding protein [[Ruminococcus] lactaris]MCB5736969.1 ATP-binding protein [[Ruminococcus] lactaris]MCB5830145.1 ATP-binding protein [[Ruminococcus] lactaris]MCB5845157.1 ATP-binding protein [[Ruminococcus] lactaris]
MNAVDKYEYKQLSERMIELMQNEEYGEAKEIADSIDWRRVRNAMMLANVSDIYEKTGEYQKSYDILQIAYHRAEGSRKVLYRLSSLALKTGNVDEAIDFYDEFVQLAPKDPNRHILRYQILRAQRAPLEQQIEALEEFKKAEYIEEWAFELAKLYQEAGMTAECLEECDDLILWFSEGKYVYKAMELKMQYKPLTPSQQEKYNRRFEKNGGETEEIPDLETYVAENEEPEDHLDEAATEHSEAVSEEPVEDIPESIGQQDTGKEESSEKPVRKPEKKKIGDTMRLDEALEQLLHRKPEVSAAEDEEPDISDLESAIGDIESVVDLDMVNQISQEKHTGDVPIGMKELIPGEVSEEAADKKERIPVEITTDITEDDAEELDLEDLVAEELPEEVEEAEPVEEEAEEVEEAEPVEEEAEKVEEAEPVEEEAEEVEEAEPVEEEAEKVKEAEPVEEEAEEVEEAEPVEEEAEEVEEAEPIEETQTGTIEEELQKIADAEPAEPEEEIFDMEEAEDFLEDSPAEDWEDDTESFEEADAEELSFEEILSDWDSEEAEALLEDAEEEVYDESVEETYEEEPDEEPNEEPDEDEAEDILEGAEEEPIEESAEDVVEADAEEIYEEEPEDEVTEDTPILSPDIQRLIDEIEGAVPAEESLPEEKEIEKAPEEPHENMGEVTESLRLDDLPEEDEDLFEDEDFLESEDEEDEYESYEDDDSEEDEYESYEDDDSEDEYTSYDEDEYEDEIYDDEYEDDDEAYYEESDDDELADDEEFYYEDEEEPDEEPDEEDAPDFEDEFKVDPKHSEEPDDREIPDEDDGIDIMSATTPLSRKETAKLIATGKTSPLPLDEISDALSMDTGFVVHGRYDLETQSGIGTRAGLTEEQKKLFSYFVPVRGMSEQLVDVLEQDKNCTNRKGTSKTGNLLIIGDKGNGKTVLAVDVVKAIQKQREIRQGKVAIVTGESLNKKKIGDIFDKLYGGALIIEKAGKMNEKTVAKLNRAMERDTGELLIVLEEQRKPLDRLLSSNREFRRKFTSRLEVPIFINDELVTFGQTYAQENGYKIDEMGILALYSCIDSLQREDHSVTVAEVKEVMDKAIAHSQKASAKKLVKRVFGRNTDSSDRIILSERDFNI